MTDTMATKNPYLSRAHEILAIRKETQMEWTFRLAYDTEKTDPHPGCFYMLGIPGMGETPISFSEKGSGYLDFTLRNVGEVTDAIFAKKPGETIHLRGPLGNGWPMDRFRGKHMVLIGGGTGVAPIKSLMEAAYHDKDLFLSMTIVVGFRDHEAILFKDALDKYEEDDFFTTLYCLDNESHETWRKGFVTEYLKEIPFDEFGDDYAVALVGPPPMMHFSALELMKNGVEEDHIWQSFERKMYCGLGKCGHCRMNQDYVCIDGPIFNYTQAKKFVD